MTSPTPSTRLSPLPRLAAATNFRDLAERVRPVLPLRTGLLFRSDHLGGLTDPDAQALRELGVRRVLDFRGTRERLSAQCALPEATVHSLAIEPTIVQILSEQISAGRIPTAEEVIGHMQDAYRGFVRHHTHRFAEFFQHLLESAEPTVFHCTAGKDRTGFAAALLLHALGAREDVIMADYLLTNERLRPPPLAGLGLPPEVAQVLWGVQPAFLQAALEAASAVHGSLEAYVTQSVGLGSAERQRLRALYLQS
jgi:protein-tyrosine phosphatase